MVVGILDAYWQLLMEEVIKQYNTGSTIYVYICIETERARLKCIGKHETPAL